jgi:hypothetical protein
MQQIGRGRPNLSFLYKSPTPETYLVDQSATAVAAATVTAIRIDSAVVAGITTATGDVIAGGTRFADVSGDTVGAIETFGFQVSYADVNGVALVIATSAQDRDDPASVAGGAVASATVLATIPAPTRWIVRAPRGRF